MELIEEKLRLYIQKKKDVKFSGILKFSFEEFKLSYMGESNVERDKETFEPITEDVEKKVSELLAFVFKNFNGSLSFKMERGRIIGYFYNRSFKGSDLRRVLYYANL